MTLPLSHTISTRRLLLRAPSAADFPHIFSATRYPNFNDGMLWEPPETEAELAAPLQRNLQAWQEGGGYAFTLQNKMDSTFIGRISIRKEEEEAVWSIGFWTHPSRQGQGYMTEAVAAVLDFGFQELGAQRIEAAYAVWNKASEKVLQRNGLTFVKYIEQGFQKKGEWVAENLLAIEKEQWEDHKLEPLSLEEMEKARLRYRRRRPLQWLCFVLALAFLLLAVFDSWWWLALSGLFFGCGVYLAIDALTYVEQYKAQVIKKYLQEKFGEQIQYQPSKGVADEYLDKSGIFTFAGVEKQETEDWLRGQWQGVPFQLSELRVLGRYRKIGRTRKREPYFSGIFLVIEQAMAIESSLYCIPHQHNQYMAYSYRQAKRHKKQLYSPLATHYIFADRQTAAVHADLDHVLPRIRPIIAHLSEAFVTIHPHGIYMAKPLDRPFLEPDLGKSVWDERALQQAMQGVQEVQDVLEKLAVS